MSDKFDEMLNKAAGNLAVEQVAEMGKVLAAFYFSLMQEGMSENIALLLTNQFMIAALSGNKNGDK